MDYISLEISSLHEKGYGIATSNGRTYWVLNVLPGETVQARVVKRKKGISFAIADEITKVSPFRIQHQEGHFLSCSPWQILSKVQENREKVQLIRGFYEEYARYQPQDFEIVDSGKDSEYRNKMEFSFYTDETSPLSLAYHKRDGAKAKYTVDTCILAPEKINSSNAKLVEFLINKKITARQLKGLLNRYSFYENKVVSVLYTKDENVQISKQELESLLDTSCKGIIVMYSTPKSPAFVETKLIESAGETDLTEKILDKYFIYPHDGFFQINPAAFETTAQEIRNIVSDKLQKNSSLHKLVDMYAGIGTLGILIDQKNLEITSVELFEKSYEYAQRNKIKNSSQNITMIQAPAEKSLEYLEGADIVILDPNRPGLHPKVTKKILETKPKIIVYLSCNPKTQAQDFNILQELYKMTYIKAFNFYPHTPHVENLIVLELR